MLARRLYCVRVGRHVLRSRDVALAQLWLRAAALALTAGSVAACSSDTSRFNRQPVRLDRPSRSHRLDLASFRRPGRAGGEPAACSAGRAGPPFGRHRSVAANPAGAGGAARPGAAPEGKPASAGNWSWEGGTADHGRTDRHASMPSRGATACRPPRSGRPTTLPAAGTVYPGQRLVIPRYSQAGVATAAAPAARPAARPRPPTPQPGRQSRRPRRRLGRYPEQDFAPLSQAGQRDCQGEQHPGDHHAQCGRPPGDSGRCRRAAAVKQPPAAAVAAQPAKPAPSTPPKASEPVQSASVVTPAGARTPPMPTKPQNSRREPGRCPSSAGRRTDA